MRILAPKPKAIMDASQALAEARTRCASELWSRSSKDATKLLTCIVAATVFVMGSACSKAFIVKKGAPSKCNDGIPFLAYEAADRHRVTLQAILYKVTVETLRDSVTVRGTVSRKVAARSRYFAELPSGFELGESVADDPLGRASGESSVTALDLEYTPISSATDRVTRISEDRYTINTRIPWFGSANPKITLNDNGTIGSVSDSVDGGGKAVVEAVTELASLVGLPKQKEDEEDPEDPSTLEEVGEKAAASKASKRYKITAIERLTLQRVYEKIVGAGRTPAELYQISEEDFGSAASKALGQRLVAKGYGLAAYRVAPEPKVPAATSTPKTAAAGQAIKLDATVVLPKKPK